jgi:MerR family transcriptional regulator, light-induced transcriptional regulator
MFSNFSIKDLEKLSGIKAHTLRIWEQRYGILKPKRTDTNIRLYCNDELKQLLNITMLYNHGFKISKIASLNNTQLIDEVNKISQTPSQSTFQIDLLLIAMVELDEMKFEKIISNNILHTGFTHTIENVIYPFLQKIGIMWLTGSINPAQEHFISNLIRQKLIVAIDGITTSPNSYSKKFVLFLPETELHELALLYYHYLIKSIGHQVIYLGQSVPINDLKKVSEIRQANFLLSVFTQINKPEEYILNLIKLFPHQKIWLAGHQLLHLKIQAASNLSFFFSASELKQLLEKTSS